MKLRTSYRKVKFTGRTSTRLEEDSSLSELILSGQPFTRSDGAGTSGTQVRNRERPPISDSNLGAKQGPSTPEGLHTKITVFQLLVIFCMYLFSLYYPCLVESELGFGELKKKVVHPCWAKTCNGVPLPGLGYSN